MILIELDFCEANILFLVIERGHKKYRFLLFQMIGGCIMWGMVVLDKFTVLDDRTIFPNIKIFLERVLTFELLQKSFRLLASTIIHYMEWKIIEFHPTYSEFLMDFFIHVWNNMNWLVPYSSFF